jgi:hypothetical protein
MIEPTPTPTPPTPTAIPTVTLDLSTVSTTMQAVASEQVAGWSGHSGYLLLGLASIILVFWLIRVLRIFVL